MRMVVLGAGKMTEALLMGWKLVFDLNQFHIFSPSGKSAEALAQKIGAQHLKNLDAIQDPDFVLVGCKPQQIKDLKKTLGPRFSKSTFISMLVAIPEEDQKKILGISRLVRAIPNIPSKYGAGVTLISSKTPDALMAVKDLFTLLGTALIVKEDELEELTLLTASGPAFFYEFISNLAQSFTSLDPKTREQLAREVFLGAAATVNSDSHNLETLIGSVTSKAGVTIAVLENWRKLGLAQKITEGVLAGKNRGLEIKAHLQN